jgi:hypothetical protein
MQNFLSTHPKLVSAIHTFVSTFIVTMLGAVSVIPADTILSTQTWTSAFVVGVLMTAVRAAIKAIFPLVV